MKRSWVQPGKAQRPSRAMTARRRAGGIRRVLRPMSRMWPSSSRSGDPGRGSPPDSARWAPLVRVSGDFDSSLARILARRQPGVRFRFQHATSGSAPGTRPPRPMSPRVARRGRRERLRTDCRRSSGQGGAIGLGLDPRLDRSRALESGLDPHRRPPRPVEKGVDTPRKGSPSPRKQIRGSRESHLDLGDGVSTRRRRGPRGLGRGVEAAGLRSRLSKPGVETQFSCTR